MKAKPRLDHHAAGRQLYAIRDQLIRMALPYPKTSKAQRRLQQAIRAIDQLRCELDQQFATETPETFTPRAYFPGGQYRAPSTTDINQTQLRAEEPGLDFERARHGCLDPSPYW